MRVNITDIYRIETMNSTYEIKVIEKEGVVFSVCKKMGMDNKGKVVNVEGTEYLDKLAIGPSFDVPGVVTTSMVEDYQHYVVSGEPKRTVHRTETFGGLADAIVRQVKGQVVRAPRVYPPDHI